ncbi:MAG: TolC family protein, partial [Gammaproteobacteria bacterium]|nr:TolC family protein [Gammaproteobacteria bacterium]
WERSVKKARAAQEQAQLDALVEKKSLALQGIPYQVAERYHQVQAGHISVTKLMESSKSARRWMIASYADFEAGLEQTDKIVSAFQGYVLTYTEYLKMVYDYNVQVAQLDYVAGAYQ